MRCYLKERRDGHALQSSPIFRFGELGGRQLELDRVSHSQNEPSRSRVKCRHLAMRTKSHVRPELCSVDSL